MRSRTRVRTGGSESASGPRCGAHGRVRTHREVGVAARVSEPPRRRHAGGYFPSYLAPQGPARRRVPGVWCPTGRRSAWRAGRPWRGAQPAASAWLEGWLQRRQPEKSGVRKLIEDVRGALPGAATGAPRPVSLPAGRSEAARSVASPSDRGAGIAFKNRDKIALKLSRDHSDGAQTSAAPGTTERSGAGVGVTDIPGPSSAAPSDTGPLKKAAKLAGRCRSAVVGWRGGHRRACLGGSHESAPCEPPTQLGTRE